MISKEQAMEIARNCTSHWRIPVSRFDSRIGLWTSFHNIESASKFQNPVWAITQSWESQSDGRDDSYIVFVDSETGKFYGPKKFAEHLRILQGEERREELRKKVKKFLEEVDDFQAKHPEMRGHIAQIIELFRFCQKKEALSFQEASDHFLSCSRCQEGLKDKTLLEKLHLQTLKILDKVGAEELEEEGCNDWRRP